MTDKRGKYVRRPEGESGRKKEGDGKPVTKSFRFSEKAFTALQQKKAETGKSINALVEEAVLSKYLPSDLQVQSVTPEQLADMSNISVSVIKQYKNPTSNPTDLDELDEDDPDAPVWDDWERPQTEV